MSGCYYKDDKPLPKDASKEKTINKSDKFFVFSQVGPYIFHHYDDALEIREEGKEEGITVPVKILLMEIEKWRVSRKHLPLSNVFGDKL